MPETTLGKLVATGTGEVRDKDGNLLDSNGFLAVGVDEVDNEEKGTE